MYGREPIPYTQSLRLAMPLIHWFKLIPYLRIDVAPLNIYINKTTVTPIKFISHTLLSIMLYTNKLYPLDKA